MDLDLELVIEKICSTLSPTLPHQGGGRTKTYPIKRASELSKESNAKLLQLQEKPEH